MKNTIGNSVAVTLFGESHGPYIGAVVGRHGTRYIYKGRVYCTYAHAAPSKRKNFHHTP